MLCKALKKGDKRKTNVVSSKKKVADLVSFSFLSTDEIVRCLRWDVTGFYFVLRNNKGLTLLLIWCECVRVRVCICVSACVWERFSEILYHRPSEKRYLLFWDTWKCLKRKIMLTELHQISFFARQSLVHFFHVPEKVCVFRSYLSSFSVSRTEIIGLNEV